jgi:NAD+ synthase
VRKDFNGDIVCKNIINWIREYFKAQPNAKGAIIGISGGKDSLVAAKLLVEALGKERVFGVLMPNGVHKDIDDSLRGVDILGIDYKIVNIEKAYNGLLEGIEENSLSNDAKINIPPRLRMTTLYALGANAFDFNPIGDLTTEEVIAVGDALGLPYELVHKTPNDGLSGQSDEEKLGFSYQQINEYIENGSCGDKEIDEKIKLKHEYNKHKRRLPLKYE